MRLYVIVSLLLGSRDAISATSPASEPAASAFPAAAIPPSLAPTSSQSPQSTSLPSSSAPPSVPSPAARGIKRAVRDIRPVLRGGGLGRHALGLLAAR